MRVNIENMLRQIGASASKKYGYEYMLQEFTKHLRELRDRSAASPSEALKACDEFFALYVFSDNQETDERAASQSTGDHNG